jgi:hypothetical protein
MIAKNTYLASPDWLSNKFVRNAGYAGKSPKPA